MSQYWVCSHLSINRQYLHVSFFPKTSPKISFNFKIKISERIHFNIAAENKASDYLANDF